MFVSELFWDGRTGRLEEQAKQPLLNPFEMGMGEPASVVARLSAIPEYQKRFEEVFGKSEISIDTITKAIAAYTDGFTELGRYLFTKKPEDIGAFRTPSLRDVELTAPYMHNGSEKTLIDVVRFYNRGGNGNSNLDKRMVPLNLTENEISELVEFMRTLTSNDVLRRAQSSTPQNRVPVRF